MDSARPGSPRQTRNQRIATWIVLLVVVAPWAMGFLLAPSLTGRGRAVPETLIWLTLGGMAILAVGLPRMRAALRRQPSFLGRHHRIALACLGLFGLLSTTFGLNRAADWLAPIDTVAVDIRSIGPGTRGFSTYIVTTEGESFNTPAFWWPRMEPGPADISVGHFSRLLLEIEQPQVGS